MSKFRQIWSPWTQIRLKHAFCELPIGILSGFCQEFNVGNIFSLLRQVPITHQQRHSLNAHFSAIWYQILPDKLFIIGVGNVARHAEKTGLFPTLKSSTNRTTYTYKAVAVLDGWINEQFLQADAMLSVWVYLQGLTRYPPFSSSCLTPMDMEAKIGLGKSWPTPWQWINVSLSVI